MPAHLERAFLFGSWARGEARATSDLDVLLVFRSLPPDREPQAEIAEAVADRVGWRWGLPLEVWSVSAEDLRRGRRTPMLVDALADGLPLYPAASLPLRLPYTPEDAYWCAGALLDRVAEGGGELAELYPARRYAAAAGRIRDDLVRLCTAHLLLRGVTRPRRGDAIRAFLAGAPQGWNEAERATFRWAVESFGSDGEKDGEGADYAPPPPAGGWHAAAGLIDRLRAEVAAARSRLRGTFRASGCLNQPSPIH